MAKDTKKTEPKVEAKVEAKPSGPVRFHRLDEKAKQAVIERMAKGQVVLRGPDSLVIEVK